MKKKCANGKNSVIIQVMSLFYSYRINRRRERTRRKTTDGSSDGRICKSGTKLKKYFTVKTTLKQRPVECNLLIVSLIMIERKQSQENEISVVGTEGQRKVISRPATRRANLQSHFKFPSSPFNFL